MPADALALRAGIGIVKKWADKYGIKSSCASQRLRRIVNQYTAGKLDVVATSMDTLTIPAAGGKEPW